MDKTYLFNILIIIVLIFFLLIFIKYIHYKIKKISTFLNLTMKNMRNTVRFYNNDINDIEEKLIRIKELNDIIINNKVCTMNENNNHSNLHIKNSNEENGENKQLKSKCLNDNISLSQENKNILKDLINNGNEDTLIL